MPHPLPPKNYKISSVFSYNFKLALTAIGHVRIDFGAGGKEFRHTWHPRGEESLNSAAFKKELGQVVEQLRDSVLKDLNSMSRFCYSHGGAIEGGWRQNYGYVVETENYRYCLRCSPGQGDYHAYLTCFDRNIQRANLVKKTTAALGGCATARKKAWWSSFPATDSRYRKKTR